MALCRRTRARPGLLSIRKLNKLSINVTDSREVLIYWSYAGGKINGSVAVCRVYLLLALSSLFSLNIVEILTLSGKKSTKVKENGTEVLHSIQ